MNVRAAQSRTLSPLLVSIAVAIVLIVGHVQVASASPACNDLTAPGTPTFATPLRIFEVEDPTPTGWFSTFNVDDNVVPITVGPGSESDTAAEIAADLDAVLGPNYIITHCGGKRVVVTRIGGTIDIFDPPPEGDTMPQVVQEVMIIGKVPLLGPWALLALCVLVATLGVVVLRRRRLAAR